MSKQLGKALITGASAGIGATYAERLARRGHDLLLVARDIQRLEAMAGRLSQEYGVKVEVLKADLSDKAELRAVEDRLRSDGEFGLLVNNAGIATNGTLAEADLDLAEKLIQLNVVALTRLAAVAAAQFSTRGAWRHHQPGLGGGLGA